MQFTKKVRKTILKGIITVPIECHTVLDNSHYCPLGASVDVTYFLQNGPQLHDRLYQSTNNTTTFYQFYIVEPGEKEIFNDHIKDCRNLIKDFDLNENRLNISSLD